MPYCKGHSSEFFTVSKGSDWQSQKWRPEPAQILMEGDETWLSFRISFPTRIGQIYWKVEAVHLIVRSILMENSQKSMGDDKTGQLDPARSRIEIGSSCRSFIDRRQARTSEMLAVRVQAVAVVRSSCNNIETSQLIHNTAIKSQIALINPNVPSTTAIMPSFASRKSAVVQQTIDQQNVDLFCFCRQPDDGNYMICCGSCDGWFHGACVGIDEENEPEQYLCSDCENCKCRSVV